MEERAVQLKNQVSYPTTMLTIMQKKYLEALKKYEEIIQVKRETCGEKSESVSLFFKKQKFILAVVTEISFRGCPNLQHPIDELLTKR